MKKITLLYAIIALPCILYAQSRQEFKSSNDLTPLNKVSDSSQLQQQEIEFLDNIQSSIHEVEEYKRQLKVSQREKDLLVSIDKNNKTIIYITIVGLVLVFGVLFFYFREYHAKKKTSDILKLKNIELSEAKNQAETLSKIKSQFISTISHELRTPLYGVAGISSMLLENKERSEKDIELLNSLNFSADYLLNLVNKVLDVSKIDSEKVNLIHSKINLLSHLKSIIQTLAYQASQKNNELRLEYDHNLPEIINIDAVRVSEVLINLLGNAIKFTENGTIWLRTKLIDKEEGNVTIRFEIQDTGIGIPEDQIAYIFDEFAQLGSLYENKHGTGLGLHIVKKILKLMDSDIHCHSAKDIGSNFFFTIKVGIQEASFSEDHKENIIDSPYPFPAKILIAEDNKINQIVTKNLLKNIHCESIIAENGQEALEMLQKETFDIVLMDINMPVLDGMQATLKIREFDTSTPIIALTASELSEVEKECIKAGMNDLVNKPLNKDDLKDVIYRNLIVDNAEVNNYP
ncbi:Signal transduction histidine kinase [Aquimarina amphilecti]|uniref:histidine kinase n=1 Tax=Aquimarina amphilecti TaxID=1038014 RepID=A0A1H7VET9_AQUAM|nr:response regulator [Aquimarina amphilecti]SEM07762.1 Signal transduction histidine kinase [Aquimarina amphilecti]